MSQLTNTVSKIATVQDLDRAVDRYKSSDLKGSELLSLWQAIRDASLDQSFSQPESDGVPAEHSY